MTLYRLWPSRVEGNLSGDFETLIVIEAILLVMRNYNGLQPPISEMASMVKKPIESNLQFLGRVRAVFNPTPSVMSENPASHDALKHTLRQNFPQLWARVEDKEVSDTSAEAFKTTIELATQIFDAMTKKVKPDTDLIHTVWTMSWP
ncbi:hypothetical protein Golomagni_04720 [Golovinomyces magnicellulatus]|nr:hypothetical protein Golomagni_04720 [Golovinomyces magnicellulatus]